MNKVVRNDELYPAEEFDRFPHPDEIAHEYGYPGIEEFAAADRKQVTSKRPSRMFVDLAYVAVAWAAWRSPTLGPCICHDDHEEEYDGYESNVWSFVFMSIGLVVIFVTTPLWLPVMAWTMRRKWPAWTWTRISKSTQWNPGGA